MRWTNKGHQYDLIGEKICTLSDNQSSFYIWGAGTFGISFFELFCHEIKIDGFIDSNPKKQGLTVCGVQVHAPDYLKDKHFFVLVSAGWTKEIYSQLNELGYVKGTNYLHIDDFTSLYYWYKYKKVCFSDITYMITEHCSLKCENCNSFVPKIKNPINVPIKQITKDFEQFFQYVDHVNILGLSGGDAMMHPDFVDIIDELGDKYYPQKAAHLEVYSNAVIIPNEHMLQIMKKYDVFYRFSDYRPYTNERQKIEEVISLLQKNGIRYDHVRFEKWCDCGYPQTSNGIKKAEDLIKFFDACDRKSCHSLCNGLVLYCGMMKGADRINYWNIDTSDAFDISVYDADKRIELIEYMLGYSEKGYLHYCQKCNGSFNVNRNVIEAGKQL